MSLQNFKHFRVERLLGRGGMGEVYLAHDVNLERKVALKFLPRELLRDPSAQGRLLDEARSVSRVQHPNIAVIHSIEEDAGVFALCMEYIEGHTLKQMMRAGRLPLAQIVHLATQIAAGMQAAHEAGIVHRDLKPANVMVTPGGAAKVMDFGLALRPRRVVDTVGSSTYGTVQYMSPEQARGESLDPRTDIFSLGSTLYEITAGRAPFQGKNDLSILQAILNDEPPRLRDIRREVPPAFEQLVRGCMAKPLGARWESMAAILDELRYLGPLAEAGPQDLISELSTGLSGREEQQHKPRNHGAVGRRPVRGSSLGGRSDGRGREGQELPHGLELPEGVVVHCVVDRGDVEYGPSGSSHRGPEDSHPTDGLDIQTTSEQWDDLVAVSQAVTPVGGAHSPGSFLPNDERRDRIVRQSQPRASEKASTQSRPRPTTVEHDLFLAPRGRRRRPRAPRPAAPLPERKRSRWTAFLPLGIALALSLVGALALLRIAGVPLPIPGWSDAPPEALVETPSDEAAGRRDLEPSTETGQASLGSLGLGIRLGEIPDPPLPRPPLVSASMETAPSPTAESEKASDDGP